MTQIILTPEQAAIVARAQETVQVCDPDGNVLASIEPEFTADDLAAAKREAASPGPWYTTSEVLEHLVTP